MKNKIFVQNLIKFREKMHLSSYELSLRIGKDASYIKQLEVGRSYPSVKVMLDICDELNITPNDLFGF